MFLVHGPASREERDFVAESGCRARFRISAGPRRRPALRQFYGSADVLPVSVLLRGIWLAPAGSYGDRLSGDQHHVRLGSPKWWAMPALTLDDPHDHRRMADMLYTVLNGTRNHGCAICAACGSAERKSSPRRSRSGGSPKSTVPWPEVLCASFTFSPRSTDATEVHCAPSSIFPRGSLPLDLDSEVLGFGRTFDPRQPVPAREDSCILPLSFPRGYGFRPPSRNGSASISIALTASSCTACGCIRTGPFSRLADGHACPTSVFHTVCSNLGRCMAKVYLKP